MSFNPTRAGICDATTAATAANIRLRINISVSPDSGQGDHGPEI
jgi:hypothetical protein